MESVTTVLRLNTRGGVLKGVCTTADEIKSVAYAADYVLLRQP